MSKWEVVELTKFKLTVDNAITLLYNGISQLSYLTKGLHMKQFILAIDPGSNGAAVIFKLGDNGKIGYIDSLLLRKIYTDKTDDHDPDVNIDLVEFYSWISSIFQDEPHRCLTVIEYPNKYPRHGSDGQSASKSLATQFEGITILGTALKSSNAVDILTNHEPTFLIKYIRPKEWQVVHKDLPPECLNYDTKDKSIAFCRLVYPDVDLVKGKRAKKPHDGMADAICMAHYAVKFLPQTVSLKREFFID